MDPQLELPLYGSISNKEVLQPLDLNSIKLWWNHNGFFDVELYERVLKAKGLS